jgi:hypothetical protein
MRDGPVTPTDPAAPVPAPDPAARAAARQAREEQIVRALNPEQARAVTTTEGPLLILAGAGSGKTRVLAHRIAYLVSIRDVAPWRILAVTFTNRAAAELRERIISLVGEGGRDVVAGTFHSLAARVLRADGEAIGIGRRFVIYDTDDQQALMKQILREEDMPLTGEFRPSAVLGAISRAKNEMLDPTTPPTTGSGRSPTSRRATRSACARRTRSTSTTCCSRPSGCSRRRQTSWRSTRSAGATSTSTNTRTPIARNTCGFGRWPPGTGTCASSATTTSRSTPGGEQTCGTSSTSSATGPIPPSSSSSRTTGRPS